MCRGLRALVQSTSNIDSVPVNVWNVSRTMVDRDGSYAFPGQKPFFFSLAVR